MPSPEQIWDDIDRLSSGFGNLAREISSFNILNPELVPKGLKPHTRSIAWLAEQIFIQQGEVNGDITEFDSIAASDSDIGLFDCVVRIGGRELLVNLKVSDLAKNNGRNDINKAYKILQFYRENPEGLLYYTIIRFSFDNTKIILHDENPIVLYPPWIDRVYVNPSNHHLQAGYHNHMVERGVDDFIDLLEEEIDTKKIPRK